MIERTCVSLSKSCESGGERLSNFCFIQLLVSPKEFVEIAYMKSRVAVHLSLGP